MYSRIARARFRPETAEEVIKVAKDSIGTFQKLPGFQSVIYHYDRVSGWGFSISLWETKEQADAAMEGLRSVTEAFAPLRVSQQPTGDPLEGALPTFEVIAQG